MLCQRPKLSILLLFQVFFANSGDKTYLYKSFPIINTISEDADLVVGYLQEVVKDFGASSVSSIITDNAETMQSTWRKLVNARQLGNTSHILFMSCSCHMLHNYVALVLKSDYFKKAFEIVNAVVKRLRKMAYRKFYRRRTRSIHCPKIPSYTKIRWGSASAVVTFVVRNWDMIIQFLMGLKSRKDKTLWQKMSVEKQVIINLSLLLEKIVKSIRFLESDCQYVGDSYYELGKLRWHLANTFPDKPDLLAKYDEIWNNSYSDITVLGVLLSPYYFNIVLNRKSSEHGFLSSIDISTEDYAQAVLWIRQLAFPSGTTDANWKEIWKTYSTQMKKIKIKDFDAGQQLWNYQVMQADFPELHKVFQSLSTSRPSTATVERVHTLFTMVMTKLRNRMSPDVLCMLVFIKANLLFGTDIKNYRITDDPALLEEENNIYKAFAESTVALKDDALIIALDGSASEESQIDSSDDDELSSDEEY